jgi:glycosyltransferase involved in cell wall biosynthesis
MLSILIPVFNYDVREFVIELYRQASACKIVFEIRCYDDGSSGHFLTKNREIEQLDRVVYREMPVNMGRAAIRNLLAKEAKYDYLLFLDNDSIPEYPDFIARYVAMFDPAALLYGGRTYDPRPPEDQNYFFHWYCGRHREVFPLEMRKAKPYQSFQTNNFIVPREIFLSILLDEHLKGYGHEDTQFGHQLMARNIPVIHIDNPLRHLGLEKTDDFIQKTEEAIKNLSFLIANGYDVSTIKLARYYVMLRKMGLTGIIASMIQFRRKAILKNIHSKNPGLRAFDAYKLLRLIEAGRQRKRE